MLNSRERQSSEDVLVTIGNIDEYLGPLWALSALPKEDGVLRQDLLLLNFLRILRLFLLMGIFSHGGEVVSFMPSVLLGVITALSRVSILPFSGLMTQLGVELPLVGEYLYFSILFDKSPGEVSMEEENLLAGEVSEKEKFPAGEFSDDVKYFDD